MFDSLTAILPMPLIFYAVAIPAVIVTGLSKGGFGGGIAMLGTPMIALMVSPVQAAAIMLPVLLAMDAIGLWSYRGKFDKQVLATTLPGAVLGIFIGWLTASIVSDDLIRILVGVIAVSFAIIQATRDLKKRPPRPRNTPAAAFWGTIAGFTSFISHAGGPPFQTYVVPLKLDKIVLAGTSVIAFSVINIIKVLPYFLLGQFSPENLSTSLSLIPVAGLGVLIGVWLVKRVNEQVFYNITYVALFIVGLKLLWDGQGAITAWFV